VKEEEKDIIGDEFELCVRDEHTHFELFLTNRSVNPFVDFSKTISYQFGPEDLKRLNFFVDLWHVQKYVQPLGLAHIFPILECLKNKKQFPHDVVKTHIKVSPSLCFPPPVFS
jgi:hypothetical protein